MKRFHEKVLKIVLTIAMIFVLTIVDFIVMGMQIVSYALNALDTTNADNVLFTTYFLDENGNKSTYYESSIDAENIKLCFEIQVKNQGYFNGQIRISDSNFRFKTDIESEYINNIDGESIMLNQINTEENVVLELAIEPIKEEEYQLGLINKLTSVEILGSYVTSAKKYIDIKDEREVQLLLKSPYSNQNELNLQGQVVTNKIYNINGENKRLVQIEITSSLLENKFPVKSTKISTSVNDDVENVEVYKRGTYATNNDNFDVQSNWNKKQNKFEINILNQEIDGKVQWNQKQNDKVLVTYVLDESVSMVNKNVQIDALVELYDDMVIEKGIVVNIVDEVDGAIFYGISNQEDLYKGNLYYGEETKIQSRSIIDIRYKNIAQEITLQEGKSTYITNIAEDNANLLYTLTKVDKKSIESVLGENGKLELKDISGNVLGIFNKESIEKVEGESVDLSYEPQREIILQLTNCESQGRLEFIHEKVLREDVYVKEKMKSFEQLKIQGVMSSNVNIESKSVEDLIQLKEAESFAKITSSTDTLTTLQTNDNVEFNVILKTDDIKFELYKNPSIEIEFPSEVLNVNAKLNPIFIDGFEIADASIGETEGGNKIIRLQLIGEQTVHSNNVSEGIILNVNSSIDIDKTIASKDVDIILRYTNENEGQNVFEQRLPIRLQSKEGLLIYNKIEGFNANGDILETVDSETIRGSLEAEDIARNLSGTVVLANNYEQNLNNITIIGRNLDDSSLILGLSNSVEVYGANARVLYSHNNIDWTDDITSIETVIAYKIEIENISVGNTVSLKYNFGIPENVGYDKIAKFQQDVMYTYLGQDMNSEIDVQLRTGSPILNTYNYGISLSSETVDDVTGDLEVTTKTMLGDEELEDGSSVYEGATLKNVITISNKTGQDINNLKVSVNQENAVIYDLVGEERVNEAVSDEVIIEHVYKEWDTGVKEFENISKLKSGEVINLTYQVVINEVEGNDKVTQGAVTISADNIETVSESTITNNIEQGEIKLITKYSYTEELQVYSGEVLPVQFNVKNIKGNDLENVTVKLKFSDCLKVKDIDTMKFYYENFDDVEEGKITNVDYDRQSNIVSLKINRLLANDNLLIVVYPIIEGMAQDESSKEVLVSSSATIENGNEYVSNIANRNVVQIVKNISIDQSTDKEDKNFKHNDTFNIIVDVTNSTDKDVDIAIMNPIDEVFIVNRVTKIKGATITDVSDDIVDGELVVLDNIRANSTIKLQINVTIDATKVREEQEVTNIVVLEYDGVTSTKEMSFDIKKESDVDNSKDNPYEKPDDDPNNPDDPDNPNNPNNPDNPNKPNDPNNPDNPSEEKFIISGIAWLDENKNGRRESSEQIMPNIEVRLIDETTGEFIKNNNGDILTQTTNSNGEYRFSVKQGNYIVMFLYNTEEYSVTEYQKSNVSENINSDVITKKVSVDGKEIDVGITDKIQVTNDNIENIDIGLIKRQIFDMRLDKYISKVIVQNTQGTRSYEYDNQQLAKVEIKSKYYKGSTVVVEYTIKVTNEGEIAGYANEIIDYLPSGFKFSSELNKDWYVSSDNNLHSVSLSNEKIVAGDTRELKLVLTKTLDQNQGGLITNMAEIYKSSNDQSIADTDSISGNKANGEDDISTASVIISVSTGAITICLIILFVALVLAGIAIFIIKKKGGKIDWRKLRVEF